MFFSEILLLPKEGNMDKRQFVSLGCQDNNNKTWRA